jgi:regulator of nucleoside diphosphate kinase
MSKPHPCQLTAKDHSILEMLLARSVGHDETYLQLLRRKLSAARIVFEDAIGPQVATINSRVDFTVDGSFADNRILIHGKDNIFPGLTLPITTLRGLALLGMTAGETITIERADGRTEALRLEWVSHQPEASRKEALYPPLHGGTAADLQQPQAKRGAFLPESSIGKKKSRPHESERGGNVSGATVVLLSAHRKPAAADPASSRRNRGDDDPGPNAA